MNNIRQSGAVVVTAFWFLLALGCCLSALAQTPEILPLTEGEAIERELKGDEVHSYSLALNAGQFLNVVVEQKGIDVVVTLFDSNNRKLTEVDSPNGTQGAEPLSMIIETTGNYRLEVRSLEKTAPAGRYEVKIKELRIATEKDKNFIVAQRAFNEGEVMRSRGTAELLRNAIKKYEESLPFYRAAEDQNGEANALNAIGLVNAILGKRVQKTLEITAQGFPLWRGGVGNKSGEARTLNNIGFFNAILGKSPQRSLENYAQALLLMRAVGNKSGEARALNNIGFFNAMLGERQKALEYYAQALPLWRAVGDKSGEAATLDNIGFVYSDLGERQKALEYYAQALPLWRAAGDKAGEAHALNNIGFVYSDLGERQKALEYYAQALPLWRAVGNKSGEAATLDNIGWEYADLGERQKALEYYAQALPLWRAVGGKEGEANTLGHVGYLMNKIANRRFAVAFDKSSVNRLQELRSNIIRVKVQQTYWKNVQQTYLKSFEDTYYHLADILMTDGRFAEAQQTLNSFKDQQFFDFDRQGKQLAPLALTVRETEFVTRYNSLADIVGEADNKLATRRRVLDGKNPTGDEQSEIQGLENRLAVANSDYFAFLKTAEKEFAAPPDDRDKVPVIADLQTMQTALRETSAATKENTVAVYTLVGEENYRALVVTPDDIFSTSYPIKGAELNQKALQLWKLLRTPEYDPQPIAAELYKIVFAPLAAKLPKDTKTILWSMDGNLSYVPMAALHDGKSYLVERFNNVIFTRADKERLTRAVSRNWTGTGFGSSKEQNVKLFDTTYKFEPLFAVETELARIFKKPNSNGIFAGDVLLNAEFTRPAMMAALKKRRPLVHIASHFKFEAGDEARSFLLLGDGSPFTLDEMTTEKDLFGGVELLTLSACQTAAQRPDATGREVDGFAELAQRLGAGAIMASLWELSDDSTAELMTRFYQTYNDGKTNKAEALRTAQLALLKGDYKETSNASRRKPLNEEDAAANIKIEKAKLRQYTPPKNTPFAHPFYWSPFVLFGNWK